MRQMTFVVDAKFVHLSPQCKAKCHFALSSILKVRNVGNVKQALSRPIKASITPNTGIIRVTFMVLSFGRLLGNAILS